MLRAVVSLSLVLLVGGFAVWQVLEVRRRDDRLAEIFGTLASLRGELQSAQVRAASADRRARLVEHDLVEMKRQSQTSDTGAMDALRAEAAAARQQLSVAETAITETENKLSEEIFAHAALKALLGKQDALLPSNESGQAALAKQDAGVTPAPAPEIEPTPTAATPASNGQLPPSNVTTSSLPDTVGRPAVKKTQGKRSAKRRTRTYKPFEAGFDALF